MPWRRMLPATLALTLALIGLGRAAVARAPVERAAGPTPARLSFVDGDVSFWRPGAEDWSPAQVNTAIAAGDSLYAGDAANLELQIGGRAFVRAGADTEIGLDSLEPNYMQFKITGGHAALDLKRLPSDQTIELDTPNAAFTIDRSGYYRVDVDQDGNTTFTVRRVGSATVIPANGESTDVGDNQQIVLDGAQRPRVSTHPAPDLDEWDRWNHDRTEQLGERPRSVEYAPDVAGLDDLDRFGDWRETPRYGHVWVPHEVPPDWAPYTTGRWVWDPYYGWTWVDYAPWGWAPYHYGRWVFTDGFWGWVPGPVVAVAPPVYAPALVAFFGAPGVGVSVSLGVPLVSWVALGFGEPCIPWWGPVGFVGRPFWGGWHGPRIVNNVVISSTTIVNVRNITKFQNVNVHNAVVAAHRDQFGRGQAQLVRLSPADVQRLRPIRGRLDVRPVAASLVAKEGHARRPPERLQARQVVAARGPGGRRRAQPPPRAGRGGGPGVGAGRAWGMPPPPPRAAAPGAGSHAGSLSVRRAAGRTGRLPGGARPRNAGQPARPVPPSSDHRRSGRPVPERRVMPHRGGPARHLRHAPPVPGSIQGSPRSGEAPVERAPHPAPHPPAGRGRTRKDRQS